MRFLFHGFDRETAKPIKGSVEASDAEAAYQILSERGIVTETLQGDLGFPDVSADEPSNPPDVAMFENALDEALENALNSSSTRVPFDALTKIYRGKKVRVIDRDKIRHRVAEVVDSTLAASEANRESHSTARERVADAIGGLFHDTRNIASEHNVQTVAANGVAGMTDAGLAAQIGKLSGVVEQAERMIAAMQAALRNVETGGTPRRRVAAGPSSLNGEQNQVLREILQSNLDLRRAIANGATQESP